MRYLLPAFLPEGLSGERSHSGCARSTPRQPEAASTRQLTTLVEIFRVGLKAGKEGTVFVVYSQEILSLQMRSETGEQKSAFSALGGLF